MSDTCFSISPNTGKKCGVWRQLDSKEMAARAGHLQLDVLRKRSLRLAALQGVRKAVQDCAEILVATVVNEVGKLTSEARAEVAYAGSFLEYAYDLCREYDFERCLGAGRRVREVPLGRALLICPFNDPVAGITRKIAPALAAGCPVLVKPSPLGALTAAVLENAVSNTGLDEVIQFIPTRNTDAIGQLIGDFRTGVVSFTGSTAVGRLIARRCGNELTPFVGELGGVNPFVVFADADLDLAAADIISRKTRAAGQACSAVNHVYAEAAIADELTERLAAGFSDCTAGPADGSGVSMGPVRSLDAAVGLAEMEFRVASAGGKRITGGVGTHSEGAPFVVAPTLYAVEAPTLTERQETFGPLLTISSFNDSAVLSERLARNTQPLAIYLYGGEIQAMHRFAACLRYGSVGINSTAIQGAHLPTGGFGEAGVGREGGPWGLAEFLTTINMIDVKNGER